jgi:hypothetical protein
LAALVGAHELCGSVTAGAMQPSGENDISGQRTSFAREIGKNQLCDILREMGVVANPAEGGRIYKIQVTLDEFTEGGFGTFSGVTAQELLVVEHLQIYSRRAGKPDSGNGRVGGDFARKQKVFET